MPSVRATVVQPPPHEQARLETTFAPGAWPSISPPKRPLPAAMPATCVPWAAWTMPMLTKSAFWPVRPAAVRSTSSRNSTTNGMDSAMAVAGLSTPKWPMSNCSL